VAPPSVHLFSALARLARPDPRVSESTLKGDVFGIEGIHRDQDALETGLLEALQPFPGHLVVTAPGAVCLDEGRRDVESCGYLDRFRQEREVQERLSACKVESVFQTDGLVSPRAWPDFPSQPAQQVFQFFSRDPIPSSIGVSRRTYNVGTRQSTSRTVTILPKLGMIQIRLTNCPQAIFVSELVCQRPLHKEMTCGYTTR